MRGSTFVVRRLFGQLPPALVRHIHGSEQFLSGFHQ